LKKQSRMLKYYEARSSKRNYYLIQTQNNS
jgi:hypothetical protein